MHQPLFLFLCQCGLELLTPGKLSWPPVSPFEQKGSPKMPGEEFFQCKASPLGTRGFSEKLLPVMPVRFCPGFALLLGWVAVSPFSEILLISTYKANEVWAAVKEAGFQRAGTVRLLLSKNILSKPYTLSFFLIHCDVPDYVNPQSRQQFLGFHVQNVITIHKY